MGKLDFVEQFDPTVGTVKQFESRWKLIAGSGEAVSFTHDLGEVPRSVSILQSSTSDGKNAATASATYTATNGTVTVTSTDSADAYFQVRAM